MTEPFRTRPVRRGPPKIARAGASVLSSLAHRTKFVDPELSDHWPSIAGAQIASLCRPGRITGRSAKTLEIIAPSGAAAAQLQMLVDDLKARVNRYLGPNAVAYIAIKQTNRTPTPRPLDAENGDTPLSAALSSFRDAVKRRNSGK